MLCIVTAHDHHVSSACDVAKGPVDGIAGNSLSDESFESASGHNKHAWQRLNSELLRNGFPAAPLTVRRPLVRIQSAAVTDKILETSLTSTQAVVTA